jgi:putative flippase GtrA
MILIKFFNKFFNKFFQEAFKFIFVGIIATIIHLTIYFTLKKIINYNIAYSLGYGISFLFNYFLSSFFTFENKPTIKKGVAFAICHLINYSLQLYFLNLFIINGISHDLSPFIVYLIVIPINFILVRFVFKTKFL